MAWRTISAILRVLPRHSCETVISQTKRCIMQAARSNTPPMMNLFQIVVWFYMYHLMFRRAPNARTPGGGRQTLSTDVDRSRTAFAGCDQLSSGELASSPPQSSHQARKRTLQPRKLYLIAFMQGMQMQRASWNLHDRLMDIILHNSVGVSCIEYRSTSVTRVQYHSL